MLAALTVGGCGAWYGDYIMILRGLTRFTELLSFWAYKYWATQGAYCLLSGCPYNLEIGASSKAVLSISGRDVHLLSR